MSNVHSTQTVADGIHVVQSIDYANAAARTGATLAAADIGRIARQTDTGKFYLWVGTTAATDSRPIGDTDFGAADIVTTGSLTAGFIGVGVSPRASAGDLRLPNAGIMRMRNAANNADVDVLTVTSGNIVTLGSVSFQTTLIAANTLSMSLTGGHTLNYNTLSGQQFLFSGVAIAATFGVSSTSGAASLFTTKGQDSSAVGGTGGARLDRAGDATGASGTRTGGLYEIRPGSGATAGGELALENGAGTKRFRINDTGLGFFAVAPVAQPADMGALTAGSGTADGTVADVGASFNQGTLNDNFQEMATKINAIRTAVRALGLMA